MNSSPYPWSVAIFAARETTGALEKCVRASIIACSGHRSVINVLINGNPHLAEQFASIAKGLDSEEVRLRVWSITVPDKAHTWNDYVYRIWDTRSLVFFIDGYVQVKPDALVAMQRRLAASPDALGVTGVPTCGRSAARLREQMLREGGIHGNLFAITAEGMTGIRTSGFRLPLGIYRTDPLIAAVLNFRLDPANNPWNPHCIAVEPAATWHVDGIEDFTWNNIKGQFKRRLRQAQGDLENRAAREHLAIRQLPPHQLPRTVVELIGNWLNAQPQQARALFRERPLCLYASRKVRTPRDWSDVDQPPKLMYGMGETGLMAAAC